jgi:hypothetical protein
MTVVVVGCMVVALVVFVTGSVLVLVPSSVRRWLTGQR